MAVVSWFLECYGGGSLLLGIEGGRLCWFVGSVHCMCVCIIRGF